MQILERFLCAAGASSEDKLVISKTFAAVIDGEPGRPGQAFGHRSGGRYAADVVALALHEGVSVTATAEECFFVLSNRLRRALSAQKELQPRLRGDLDEPGTFIAIYSDYRQQLWRLGDCRYLIDGTARSEFRRGAVSSKPAADLIEIIDVLPGSEVVLATNGYPLLCPTLSDSEAALAASLEAVGRGADEFFDDRAFIRLVA